MATLYVSTDMIAADVEHVWLHAYVGSGVNNPTPIWKDKLKCSFGQIHRGRPEPARFAIAEKMTGEFLLFDMFEVVLNDDFKTFGFPDGAVRCFPSLDTAIMTAKLKL